jgi:hypothetical protein
MDPSQGQGSGSGMIILVGVGKERAGRMQVAIAQIYLMPPSLSLTSSGSRSRPGQQHHPGGPSQRISAVRLVLFPLRLRSPSPRKEAKDYVISSSRRTPDSSLTRRSIYLPRRNTQQLNPIETESAVRASSP